MSGLDAAEHHPTGRWPKSWRRDCVLAGTGAVTITIVLLELSGPAAGGTARQLAMLAVGILVSVVDLREQRIPNAVTAPAAVLLLTSAAAEALWAWLTGAEPSLTTTALLPLTLAGAALAGGAFLLLAVIGTLGLGDVKLAALLGAVLLPEHGMQALAVAGIGAYLLAVPHAIVLLLRRNGAERAGTLPFGPYLVAGSTSAVLLSLLR